MLIRFFLAAVLATVSAGLRITADEGGHLDPNGSVVNRAGSSMDPNGRPQGGGAMDPNGLSADKGMGLDPNG